MMPALLRFSLGKKATGISISILSRLHSRSPPPHPDMLSLLGPAQKVPLGSWKKIKPKIKPGPTSLVPLGRRQKWKKKTHCSQYYALQSSFPSPFKAIRQRVLPVRRQFHRLTMLPFLLLRVTYRKRLDKKVAIKS